MFLGTLAAAYAENGQFDKAIKTAREACDRAKTLGQPDLLARNRDLLKLYEGHQPYREIR